MVKWRSIEAKIYREQLGHGYSPFIKMNESPQIIHRIFLANMWERILFLFLRKRGENRTIFFVGEWLVLFSKTKKKKGKNASHLKTESAKIDW